MDQRLTQFLHRIGQADRALREKGRGPEQFLLLYAGAGSIEVLHAGWDPSWPTPTAQDIDDLQELRLLRVAPSAGLDRKFDLTVLGREEAAILDRPQTVSVGGQAPPLNAVLTWLLDNEERLGQRMDNPVELLDAAAEDGLIDPQGREALAARLVSLHESGHLEGDLPDSAQATNITRLELSEGLSISMKAHDRASAQAAKTGSSITVLGSVISSQIAAGDISNYVSFAQVLDAADAAISELSGLDEVDKAEARGLIEALKGKATSAGGQIATGAGGSLVGATIARLLGLPV